MVPQSWLSYTTEEHYVVPKTLPQDITRGNIERSISRLSEGMDTPKRDMAKAQFLQKQQKAKTTAAGVSRVRKRFCKYI